MKSSLLYELADVVSRDVDAIAQPYAWPPRAPLSADELREVQRLAVLSRRIAYRAAVTRYEEGSS